MQQLRNAGLSLLAQNTHKQALSIKVEGKRNKSFTIENGAVATFSCEEVNEIQKLYSEAKSSQGPSGVLNLGSTDVIQEVQESTEIANKILCAHVTILIVIFVFCIL